MRFAFDIGNVLCRVNLTPFINKLVEKDLVLDYDTGYTFLESFQASHDLGTYNLKHSLLSKFTHLNKNDITEFTEIWCDAVKPIDAITELLEELNSNKQVYAMALLSNVGEDHAKIWRQFKSYNKYIQHFSFEVGARKPSKLYFQSFLIEHPGFKGALFIDDRLENLATAYKVGFEVCNFSLENYPNDNDAYNKLKEIIDTGLHSPYDCSKETLKKLNIQR